MKKVIRLIVVLLLAIALIAGGYVGYLFASYHRVGDIQALEISGTAAEALASAAPLRAATWNLGFGAYSADYSFFLDGGSESRARSVEAVHENIGGAIRALQSIDADLVLLQELDFDSTRSHYVDEIALVRDAFPKMNSVFAQNYDSAYLLFPPTEPHGASKSGILTLSKAAIDSSQRRSLPVETGVMKFFDLDRCYCVSRIPVDNGKTLCLYNVHLSAYTSDGSISTEQFKQLLADMAGEYAAGNYVIAGGDFNKDLPGNSAEIYGLSDEGYNWAQPLPVDLIPDGLALVSSVNPNHPVPSCRNADRPYTPGESFVLTVDGFIVSDNVSVLSAQVEDEGFAFSDHNPVTMEFILSE